MESATGGGLEAFNDEVTEYADRLPLALAVFAQHPSSGTIIAGALGRSSLGLLFLDFFYIRPEHRRGGLGTIILRTFEEKGKRGGCIAAVLYTINFQAPDFYARNRWQHFGEIPCLPKGTSRVFMSKRLVAVAPS